jgi:hypothetical protein
MGFRLVILWLRKLAAATDTLMQRTSLLYNALFSVILIAGPVCLDAQQTSTSRPASVNGIGIPPVAGVPFTATVVIERDRFMDDGSVITRRTINIIARDSSGRTHNEVRRLEPEYFHGSPELMEVRLYDPQTRLRTTYYPATHLARQQAIPEQSKTASLATPWTSREDLGTDTLNGLEVKGTRRKFVVSAHASGTGKPVEVVEEFWYSPELHLTLLGRHTDPRSGEDSAGVSGIKREEPPASMFQLPAGYKMVDTIPPAAPAPVSAPERAKDPMGDELP